MMSTRILNFRGPGRRRTCGQGIVEGVFGTWLIVTVGIAVLLLMLNVGLALMYQQKLNAVATAAANHLSQGSFWIGMELPTEELEKTLPTRTDEAKALVRAMVSYLNLGQVNEGSWDIHPTISEIGQKIKLGQAGTGEARISTVSFSVNNLGTIGSVIQPFGLKAVGISAESASPAYGTCTLHFRDATSQGGALRNIRIPIYFEGIAGNTTNHVLKKGHFVGNPIQCYMAVDAVCYRGEPQHPKIGANDPSLPPSYGDTSHGFPLPWWGYGNNNAFLPPLPPTLQGAAPTTE